MLRAVFALLLFIGSGCGPALADEAGLGIVTAGTGTVAVDGRPLQLMDPLRRPAVVRVAAGAELVIFLYGGAREYTLAGPGVFAVGTAGVTRTGATGSVTMKRMDPLLAGIAGPRAGVVQAGAKIRGADAGPAQAEILDPSRPVFRWPAHEHTGDYQLLLADAGDQALYRAEAAGNEAVPPQSVQLAAGARYRLELTWREPGGQLRMHAYHFATLSARQALDLERLRPAPDAPRASQTLFGLWLRSLGARSLAQPYLEP